MQIDHVHFYVEDARKWRNWFVQVMGFGAIASGSSRYTRTEVVSSGCPPVTFVLSSPLAPSSPVAQFLQQHPPGVADIAFRVDALESAINRAIKGGAKIRQPVRQRQFSQGQMRWSQIAGRALNHTLVERTGVTPPLPQTWIVPDPLGQAREVSFTDIDHVVLNVAAGELEKSVSWYEAVLGFQRQQTFTIGTERSALYSQVMVHPTSRVQFPINEPMSANSQIQEFLDLNRGAGIQHLALKTANITQVTQELRAAGLSFLKIPADYYTQLTEKTPKFNLSAQEWQEIIEQEVLIDCQNSWTGDAEEASVYPLLLQIFTQPIFTQPTFFFELIERRFQAKGFGEGNFRALFAAIEREQFKRGSLNDPLSSFSN